MSFLVYDIIFLVIFSLFAVLILYRKRKNLRRQGWMFLYHTQWGVKIMDRWARKYERILRPLQYVIIGVGLVLLMVMTYLLIVTVYDYVTSPFLARALKIPPLLPLIPYFPQIFRVETLFPPFYFTYFLLAIAIVAVFHEFAHGLIARLHKVKIKSTGFAFFGPFFGAFVEQDDRDMKKIGRFEQMAILAAGVFANILLAIFFALVIWGFFAASFTPAGVHFNTYTTSIVNVSSIDSIEGVPFAIAVESMQLTENLTEFTAQGMHYFAPGTSLREAYTQNITALVAYEDSPAFNARLSGPIVSIDGAPTRTIDELRDAIRSRTPGETVTVTTVQDDAYVDTELTLTNKSGNAYLGIGINSARQTGIRGVISGVVYEIKDPFTYYVPTWGGDFAWFVYYLLWWLFMINLLVALFNMLPLGILDGGRFFYLTIWSITGRERWGRNAFKVASWFFVALLALMMVRWVFAFL